MSKVDVSKLKTGIVVLDELNWAMENGTDKEFVAAVGEFCAVGRKLPNGAFLSVKYAERLMGIVEMLDNG